MPFESAAFESPPWPDFLANCGLFAQAAAEAAVHRRSFLSDEYGAGDLERWLSETRPRVVDLLHYAPPSCDLDPEVVATERGDGYRRETILISTAPWSRLRCELLVPDRPRGGRWPAPAVVALHCHSGWYRWGREKVLEPADPASDHPALRRLRRQNYGGRGYANELARRGYVVAVVDMFYFGERRLLWEHGSWPEPYRNEEAVLEPDSEPWLTLLNRAHKETQARVAGALFQAGVVWPGVMAWDDRRTVDFLVTREEVDPSRIGCLGLSVGGYRSALLAATDERIRAAVAVGWLCGLGEFWPVGRWPNSLGWVHYVPGMYQELDLPDAMALAAPRALLVMQNRDDLLFPRAGMERAVARIAAAYDKAGIPGRFRARIGDGPHEFNLAMQDDSFAFLDAEL
jgi:dienelactone hydrolase